FSASVSETSMAGVAAFSVFSVLHAPRQARRSTMVMRDRFFIFCRLSVIGYRLSVVGYRLSVVGCRLSVIGYRLSVIGYWLSSLKIEKIMLPGYMNRPESIHGQWHIF